MNTARHEDTLQQVREFLLLCAELRVNGSLTLHIGDGVPCRLETREFRRLRRAAEKKHEQR